MTASPNISPLTIVGASTRAAAYSARRAGWTPYCADAFADADLRQIAESRRAVNYPFDLPSLTANFPPGPCIYTGALENHPRVLAALAEVRPLFGIHGAALAAVRDPFRLYNALATAGLPALDVRRHDEPPPADGRWVRKPLRSAGGRHMEIWNATHASCAGSETYFQQFAGGIPMSALYVADGHLARLIGVARQMIGEPDSGSPPFGYCGSIAPATVPPMTERQLQQIGEHITMHAQLRGLFGVDFVFDGAAAWVTEVNPRYTASVELFEWAFERSLLEAHLTLFTESELTDGAMEQLLGGLRARRVVGKSILYATHPFIFGRFESLPPAPELAGMPRMADIPFEGTAISPGQPICTVLAAGGTMEECRRRLQRRSTRVRQLIRAAAKPRLT